MTDTANESAVRSTIDVFYQAFAAKDIDLLRTVVTDDWEYIPEPPGVKHGPDQMIPAFERMANLATRAGVEGTSRFRIHAPLLHLSKAEIIALGLSLGVDYGGTSSCYDPLPTGEACGRCDACLLRLRGFEAAGVRDPIAYAPR